MINRILHRPPLMRRALLLGLGTLVCVVIAWRAPRAEKEPHSGTALHAESETPSAIEGETDGGATTRWTPMHAYVDDDGEDNLLPIENGDTLGLHLPAVCVENPDLSCVNASCHPQSATSADRAVSKLILSPECLKTSSTSCFAADCHPKPRPSGGVAHTLFLEEKCNVCHVEPGASLAPLLDARPDVVCLFCHMDVGPKVMSGEISHPPGKRICIACHHPHQSTVRGMLYNEVLLDECAECHGDFLAAAKKRPYRHRHFEEHAVCQTCHYTHRIGLGKHVRETAMAACLTCHDVAIQYEGRVIENIKERLQEAPVVHGGIKQGTCPKCHTPHGSDRPSFLKSGYPAGTHEEYTSEQYALCTQCHPKALIESENGDGVTRFRQGSENLHHRHLVNLGRSRACHLCHEPHASDNLHLLRDNVRFDVYRNNVRSGNWTAPLKFTPSEKGGQCLGPCHREEQSVYERSDAPYLVEME